MFTGPKGDKGDTGAPAPDAIVGAGTTGTPLVLFSSTPALMELSVSTDSSGSLECDIPFGTVAGNNVNPTTAVVSISVTGRIFLDFDDFDDDNSLGGVGASFLEILAFEGCTDLASCSGITPTVIPPGRLPVLGMSEEVLIGDNDDSLMTTGYVGTDNLQFVLAGPNTGDYFLAGRFRLFGETATSDDGKDDGELVPQPGDIGGGIRRQLQTADVDLWVDQYVAVITPAITP